LPRLCPNLIFQFDGWDNYVYDFAARNSIDVGEFLGMCLAGLSNRFQISGGQIHLAGHSLGSHLMGKAARTFQMNQDSQELIGRLTGLDPAGPRFVDGPYVDAIPELAENILTKESAAFVDVIHSNGGFEPCVVCPTTECEGANLHHIANLCLLSIFCSQVWNHTSAWTHGLLSKRGFRPTRLHVWDRR